MTHQVKSPAKEPTLSEHCRPVTRDEDDREECDDVCTDDISLPTRGSPLPVVDSNRPANNKQYGVDGYRPGDSAGVSHYMYPAGR